MSTAVVAVCNALMSEPETPCPACGGAVQAFLRASTALTGVVGYCVECGFEQVSSPRERGAALPQALPLPPLFEEVLP